MKTNRIANIAAALAAVFINTSAFAEDTTPHAKESASVPKDYPLTKCVVSDEKLGEHGKPIKVTSDGIDVWLCCKDCVKDFKKEPAKFVKMVKDAPVKKK